MRKIESSSLCCFSLLNWFALCNSVADVNCILLMSNVVIFHSTIFVMKF